MNDPLLQPLLDAIAADDDDAAEAAVAHLSTQDGSAIAHLAHLSVDGNDDQRWWATRALAELAENAPAQRDQIIPTCWPPSMTLTTRSAAWRRWAWARRRQPARFRR